jgi:hypothetical protein
MLPYSITIILYNFFLFFMVPYINDVANRARLGLTTGQVADVNAFWVTWQTTFAAYMNPLTYGTVNTGAMNDFYAIVSFYVQRMQQQIKNNPTVTLTAMDYVVMAIHKNLAGRHSHPIPKEEAGIAVKSNQHLNTEFVVFDLAAPTHAAKPKYVERITPFILYKAHGSPLPVDGDLIEQTDVTRMTFDVPHTTEQIDMDGYIQVCFTNDAGQGIRSAIVPFRVI